MSFDDKQMHSNDYDVLTLYEFQAQAQAPQQPEENLMLAVLGDALFCFQKYHRAGDREGKKQFADAQYWLFDNGEEWPFSFTNICAALRISPGYLRRALLRWEHNLERRQRRAHAGIRLRHNG